MTTIRIDTEHARDVSRRLIAEGDHLAEIGHELQRAIGGLDTGSWDGRSRARAEPMLDRVRPESARVADELDHLGRKLRHVAETFEQEDNTAARNLEGMGWVDFETTSGKSVSWLSTGGIVSVAITIDQITNTLERIKNWRDGKGWKTDKELKLESDKQHQKQVKSISNYLAGKSELEPENWQKLTLKERERVLAEIEQEIAQIHGRPAANFQVSDTILHGKDKGDPMPNTQNGYHNPGNIVLNSKLLASDDPTQALKTLIHEGRHAYQHAAVNDPSVEPNGDKVNVWKKNLNNYKTAEKDGFRAYSNQPVEIDARSYADDVLDEYTNT